MRIGVAHVKNERIPRGNIRFFLFITILKIGRTLINNSDFFWGNFIMSQNIFLDKLGHGNDPPGFFNRPPDHRPISQILYKIFQSFQNAGFFGRKMAQDQIMNRDHELFAVKNRRVEMGKMHKINPVPSDQKRKKNLFKKTITGKIGQNFFKIFVLRKIAFKILLAQKNNVDVFAIDFFQIFY